MGFYSSVYTARMYQAISLLVRGRRMGLCGRGQLQVLCGAPGLYCALDCSSPALVHVNPDKEREREAVWLTHRV